MTLTPADDAPLIVATLADLQAGALPLPTALRVIAGEVHRPAWRVAFEQLAAAIDRGTSLPQALEAPEITKCLPAHLRGLLNTAATGNSVSATIDMLEYHRTAGEERQNLLRALAYPGLVVVVALIVCTFAAWLVTDHFMPMFAEFSLELPVTTQLVQKASYVILFAAVYLLPLAILAFLLVAFLGGAATLASLLPVVPLIGPVLHWSAIAELLRVTARLIDEGISLPQALRWGAEGQSNSFIAEEARRLATEVEQGMPLHIAWNEHPLLPESLGPLLRLAVGEHLSGRMLRAAAELLSTRVKQRTELVTTILPPILFLVVGMLIFAIIYSTIVPMIEWIHGMLFWDFSGNRSRDLTLVIPSYLNLSILVIPAFCMLLSMHILYGHSRVRNSFRQAFTVGAYALFVFAICGVVIGTFAFSSLALFPVIFIILSAIWIRYRRGDDRGLLAGLALAADEQIPLVDMAAAFATERRGGRARLVQQALTRGIPLSKALRAGGIALPAGALAAIALGEHRGEMGPLLRESLEPLGNFDAGLNRFVQRFLIWLVLMLKGVAVWLFLAMNIIPVYLAMEREFGVGLYPSGYLHFLGKGTRWFLSPGVELPLLLIVPLTFLILIIQQLGFSPNWIPFVPWLRRRYDSAVILHTLAAGIRSSLPVPAILRLMADSYPVKSIRTKLRKTVERTEAGEDGWSCLQTYGLLRPREAAALRAAGRVGNLAFVLSELSRTVVRRLEFRLHVGTHVLQVIGLIALGTLAVIATVSVILPLSALTTGLSGAGS